MFRLPFLQFIAGWTFAALLVVLIITAVFHYLNGGIRLQTPFQRVTPQVKVHISVILALMALTKTVQYYLARYALTLSHRGTVDGATYTDVKAQLPALNLLMLISVAAAFLFIANIFRKGWVFPIIAVGLWGFISIVVGTVYPAIIQRFVVQPNEFAREETYIKRNIDATRAAFGLDDIKIKSFDYSETDVGQQDIVDSKTTLDNVRLWDPPEIKEAISATQEFQPYFKFSDVDIDRYDVNGVRVPALTGVRELDAANIPELDLDEPASRVHPRGWRRHREGELAQAGLARLPHLRPSADGRARPEAARRLLRRGIHRLFGRRHQGRRARGNGRTSTIKTEYKGDGGVKVSSFAAEARVRAAIRRLQPRVFGPAHEPIPDPVPARHQAAGRDRGAVPAVGPRSLPGRVERPDLVDARRVHDDESLPVLAVDQSARCPSGSGLVGDFNYVRNSVKATVDSYDGTVHFYVVDPKDPIIHTYSKAFPDLFDDVKDMPAGLQDHWRYPEDMFDTQTEQYTQYHMTDPQQFFQKGALWDVAPNPDNEAATHRGHERRAGR